MGAQALQTKDIARAQGGVITDRTLAHLIEQADAAETGNLSQAGAELLLLCLRPLLAELAEHRRQRAAAMDINPDATMRDALPVNATMRDALPVNAVMRDALPPHMLPGNVVQLRGDA